jgi:hypothetical protein
MVRCKLILDNFPNIYRIATVFCFATGILWPNVKCYVYLFFTSRKIETRCKTYSIFFFTSGIFSTDVKPLLLSHICTSGIKQILSCKMFVRQKIILIF